MWKRNKYGGKGMTTTQTITMPAALTVTNWDDSVSGSVVTANGSTFAAYSPIFMLPILEKTQDEEVAEKLKRFMRFRDLKIIAIKDLGDGNLEITLSRRRKYFKIKITGKLILEDVKGEELDELGEIREEKIYINPSDGNMPWTTTPNTAAPYIAKWDANVISNDLCLDNTTYSNMGGK